METGHWSTTLTVGAPHQLRLDQSAKASYPLPTGEGETQRLVDSLQRDAILSHAKTRSHEEDIKPQPLDPASSLAGRCETL